MSSWDVPKNPRHFIDSEWKQIPGETLPDKRDWLIETVTACPGDAVDIGVWGGRSSLAMACGITGDRTLWTVDPYSAASAGSEVPKEHYDQFIRDWGNEALYTKVRSEWLTRLIAAGLLSRVRMLEIPDEKACPLFKDESLGFVHVDGNHGEVGQRETAIRWFKKLKPGGILCQDDTDWPAVLAGAVPAADARGERIFEGPGKKWIAWRKF